MKYKTLLKKINLQEEDFKTIKDKVAEMEAKTNGEIALGLTGESAHYAYWELLASNIFASLVILILLPFSHQILSFFKTLYWQNEPSWILPGFFLLSYLISLILGFYITNIPAIDKLIIPAQVQSSCVTHRAMRYFAESGVYATNEHSGILIFVSYMEHQVRIIADSGISQKISQDMWNLIADELTENLKNKKTTEAFTTAIEKCGKLLEENFPAKDENPNELADGLVILEDSEWY